MLVALAAPVWGRIPETFSNLQVLPKDSSRGQVVATMPALGGERQEVGCYTCHRGQKKPPEQLSVLLSRLAREQGAPARWRVTAS